MKIQSSNYEFTHKRRLKPGYDSAHPDSSLNNNAGVCEIDKSKEYCASFSGKLPDTSVTAAKTFMEKIMDTRAFHWLTGFAGAHNVAAAALVGLFLAGGLRPAITIALPGKKDIEDKIYAAGHSMASALIGFGFSTLITTPIDSGIKFIMKDAKKMSQEDYDKLSVDELAEHIRKNNLTPEKIAEKMKTKDLTEEMIVKQLKDSEGKALSPKKIAEFVKANNGQIISTRHPKNKLLTIVSSKVDEVNALKHKLAATTDMVEKGKLLGQIRSLEKHIGGIDTTMHNVSEWVIAIPRAMLTIALIPFILKYVFHVEKKKSDEPKQQAAVQPPVLQTVSDANRTLVANQMKMFKNFVGGNK